MAVLQIDVSERLVSKIGMETLRKKMQQLLELQELRLLALEINEQIRESGLDESRIFREAKRAAWERYKAEKLHHILS